MARRRENTRKYIEGSDALLLRWTEFANDIKKNNYDRIPTILNFCEYTNNKITNTMKQLEKWDEDCGKEIRQIIADVLVEGTAQGVWNHQIVTQVLKNTCNWGDGKKTKAKEVSVMSEAEARKALSQYMKTKNK